MFPYLIVRENIHGVDETAALSPTLMHRPIVIYRQHLIEGQWPTYHDDIADSHMTEWAGGRSGVSRF